MKCVICGEELPEKPKDVDHCLMPKLCGIIKTVAWDNYIRKHKTELMQKAIQEYRVA